MSAEVRAYSKAREGSTALMRNFKIREFACQDGTDTVFVAPELAATLQRIRDHFGRAVTINSGYRTEAHNKAVGGSPYSQHKYGTAADIVVSGKDPLTVARYAQTILPNKGGIGLYQWGVHVDVRAAKARWDSRSGREIGVGGF